MTAPANPPKIAIFGLGAITITIARALSKSSISFSILCRNEERKQDLLRNPIQFQFGSSSAESLPLYELAETIAQTQTKFDIVFIGSKNQDLQSSIEKIYPLLVENGKLILIQNGFPEDRIKFPTKQIIGGIVGWNTQKLASGVYFQSNIGTLILGGADGEKPDDIFGETFQKFIPIVFTTNLQGYRWHKIGINSVINGLAASCMLPLGKLMLNREGRRAGIKVITEVRDAMDKSGITEGVVPGSVSICKLGNGKGALPLFIRHFILIVLGIKYFKIRTSMVQDLDAGRQTEINDLNGAVVKIGHSLGIPVKVNAAICERVKLLEQHKIQANLQFLKELNLLE